MNQNQIRNISINLENWTGQVNITLLSGNFKDEIKSETDTETLKKWLKLAARANSLEEFVAKMKQ